jgi:hypothetical protein
MAISRARCARMALKARVAERPWPTQNSRRLRTLAAYGEDGEESFRVRRSWTDPNEVFITGDIHCVLRASAVLRQPSPLGVCYSQLFLSSGSGPGDRYRGSPVAIRCKAVHASLLIRKTAFRRPPRLPLLRLPDFPWDFS